MCYKKSQKNRMPLLLKLFVVAINAPDKKVDGPYQSAHSGVANSLYDQFKVFKVLNKQSNRWEDCKEYLKDEWQESLKNKQFDMIDCIIEGFVNSRTEYNLEEFYIYFQIIYLPLGFLILPLPFNFSTLDGPKDDHKLTLSAQENYLDLRVVKKQSGSSVSFSELGDRNRILPSLTEYVLNCTSLNIPVSDVLLEKQYFKDFWLDTRNNDNLITKIKRFVIIKFVDLVNQDNADIETKRIPEADMLRVTPDILLLIFDEILLFADVAFDNNIEINFISILLKIIEEKNIKTLPGFFFNELIDYIADNQYMSDLFKEVFRADKDKTTDNLKTCIHEETHRYYDKLARSLLE